MTTSAATDARVALLGALIDYAGLFPPARLPVEEALAEYRAARASDAAFMLGRFVCPASRVVDLGDEALPVSAVLDAPLPDDPRIEAIEARLAGDLRELAGLAREAYVEVADAASLPELAAAGVRAKVRCGGERVPSVEELAGLVRRCRELGLVFKATAGLHHPISAPGRHGFLNLLAASVFGDEEAALVDEEPSAFTASADRFRWRDRYASPVEVARVRHELFVGFGSCSFAEPVQDLKALGVLPL